MKEYLSIAGGKRLSGETRVSGAKNAALPILMATLLSSEECVLENVPDLEDIAVTIRLLRRLGAEASYKNNRVVVRAKALVDNEAPHALVKAMRASFWVLGPILARTGEAKVALPGGDAIGTRPVDLHIKGLMQLGAEIRMQHGSVIATAPGGLQPARVVIDYPSVGATHHLMMTAALIPGETILENAAREPEIVEMGAFLQSLGAKVEGAGTSRITIVGQRELGPGHKVIEGDRIEASTYLSAAAITGGEVLVRGISEASMKPVIEIFRRAGCECEANDLGVALRASSRLKPVEFSTEPFPGVPTDSQPLLMAALTTADGASKITETVFESRFGHAVEYRKFGAEIHIAGRTATIVGRTNFSGAVVEGGDIRAAAGLVVMGLRAEGLTEVYEVHHLDRGYENMVDKLRGLGAEVVRVPAFDGREVVLGC